MANLKVGVLLLYFLVDIAFRFVFLQTMFAPIGDSV